MPLDRRDELGLVTSEVAESLTACFDRGPRPAVRANVAIASGVLLLVPDAARPEKFTAMAAVLQAVRAAKAPLLVVDPNTNIDDIVTWLRLLPETSGSVRVVVTGPRATRWTEGESIARRIVGALAMSA
jgi:hypothetical protein